MILASFTVGLALLLASAQAHASRETAGVVLHIEAHGQRLTLHARDVPLRLILQRIGEVARVSMHIEAPADEVVSADLDGLSLDDSLRRLLRHRNAVLVYETATGPLVAVRVVRPASLPGSRAEEAPADPAWGEPVEPGPLLPGVANGASDGAHTEADDAGTAAVARASSAVDAIEDELRALTDPTSLNVPRFFDRLRDPEPSVRLTALQWLVTRPEARLPALASALKDSDAGVQAAAAQMIIDQEVSEETMQQVLAAAETSDAASIVLLLHRLLPP
jgi:hypothetical protein